MYKPQPHLLVDIAKESWLWTSCSQGLVEKIIVKEATLRNKS